MSWLRVPPPLGAAQIATSRWHPLKSPLSPLWGAQRGRSRSLPPRDRSSPSSRSSLSLFSPRLPAAFPRNINGCNFIPPCLQPSCASWLPQPCRGPARLPLSRHTELSPCPLSPLSAMPGVPSPRTGPPGSAPASPRRRKRRRRSAVPVPEPGGAGGQMSLSPPPRPRGALGRVTQPAEGLND